MYSEYRSAELMRRRDKPLNHGGTKGTEKFKIVLLLSVLCGEKEFGPPATTWPRNV